MQKRQFHTVRRIIAGDEGAIGMLPTKIFHLAFKWSVAVAASAGIFLLVFELYYFYQLDESIPQTAWIIGMGLLRDAIFVALAFEVLCWYWISLVALKRELWRPA